MTQATSSAALDETLPVGWATPAEARAIWPSAPKNPTLLVELLRTAYELCSTYAPAALAVPEPRPADYRPPARAVQAQVLHARAVWMDVRTSAEDTIGLEDTVAAIAAAAPALTGKVRQLLRPPRGVPGVG